MSASTYTVVGMTYGHCVASVTEGISAIDGVTDVAVDLPVGTVRVTGERSVGSERVHTAVEAAGCRLGG